MKKTIIALAALAFSGAVLAGGPDPMAAPAAPQDNMYLGFNIAMTSTFSTERATGNSRSYEMTFDAGGFQVGMMFGAIRAEVAADYSRDANTGAALSAFVKGAYDIQLGHGLSVYPVAGIGLVHSFEENGNASSTDFAWLLGAGTTLALNDKTSISGEYNYVRVSKDATGTATSGFKDFGANAFSVRWNRTF